MRRTLFGATSSSSNAARAICKCSASASIEVITEFSSHPRNNHKVPTALPHPTSTIALDCNAAARNFNVAPVPVEASLLPNSTPRARAS